MREKLRKLWHWSTKIPEEPRERLQRAQELVVVSITLFAIEAVVIVMQIAVLVTLIQSLLKKIL